MSKQQPQHNSVPEINVEALIKVMRAFNIRHVTCEDKPYAIRFVGSPFNTFVEDCRSILVFTHSRGATLMSPLNVKAILNKFEIPEADFLEELNKLNQSPMLGFPREGFDIEETSEGTLLQ